MKTPMILSIAFIVIVIVASFVFTLNHTLTILDSTTEMCVGLIKECSDKQISIDNHLSTIKNLKNNYLGMIKELNEKLAKNQDVTITFYHPNSRGINSDSDPNKTASLTKPKSGWTIAISRELFDFGWFGSKVYIEGYGVFKAEDRMGKSIKGKCIDICVSSKKEALRLGRVFNVKAVLL